MAAEAHQPAVLRHGTGHGFTGSHRYNRAQVSGHRTLAVEVATKTGETAASQQHASMKSPGSHGRDGSQAFGDLALAVVMQAEARQHTLVDRRIPPKREASSLSESNEGEAQKLVVPLSR